MNRMSIRVCIILSAVSALLAPLRASAQGSTAKSPSKVVMMRYEEVKPGAAAMHDRIEAEYMRSVERAADRNYHIALSSVTGPTAAMVIEGYDSYTAIEESRRHVEDSVTLRGELDTWDEPHGKLLNSSRTMLGTYREDLSYRPDIDLNEIRYIKIFTVHVRPGREADYAESIKLVLQIAKADIHWSMYQVKSGAPDGTYIILMSIKTIGDMDIDPKRDKYVATTLSPENRARVQKLASESYTMEMAIFATSPKRTYVKKNPQ